MVSTRGGKNTSPDDETPTSPITPKVTSPSSAKKLPVRSKDEVEEPVAAKPAKSKIVVFGDDDDEVDAQITQAKAAAAAQQKQEQEAEQEEEEASDDEAPEAVSTSKAADAARQSIKASQKAAQEYVHISHCITS